MSAGARVAAFAGLLVAIFAAAALAGHAIDPPTPRKVDGDGHAAAAHGAGAPARAQHGPPASEAHGAGAPARAHHGPPASQAHGAGAPARARGGTSGSATHRADAAADGLATSRSGYRLVASNTRFVAGSPSRLRLRIVDTRGNTVRAFETEQTRRMHLIVVRRDLRRYQHLHPEQQADGAWTIPLKLPEPGVYRAFADFRIAGSQHVLGVDLFVPGEFSPRQLPARGDSASVDGYEVRLHAHGADELTFAISRRGRRVTDLQHYLGARGHLVALREGDLAYRHVHPVNSSTNEIAFATRASEAGVYRLFLQFRHAGRVHTAAFTR